MTLDADLSNPDAGPRLVVFAELIWPTRLGEDTVRRCTRGIAPDYLGATLDGDRYVLDDLAFSEIKQSTGSERIRLEMSLQNDRHPVTGEERPWTAFAAGRDLNETEVRLHVREVDHLADTDIPSSTWYVSGYSAGRRLRLNLGAAYDALMLETPGVPLGSQTCLWAALGLYRRHPCGSTSSLDTCDGSLGACSKRFPAGSVLRFGPSFPLFVKGTRRRRA